MLSKLHRCTYYNEIWHGDTLPTTALYRDDRHIRGRSRVCYSINHNPKQNKGRTHHPIIVLDEN